ncbi:hypothetical protein [Xanthobacter autotrophicus]|uniref:hypothetical protein n=1 Tax=Xanthobacter autotrophicus TaxID=280 RepID=UPI0024A730E7|nr:hypothetical protein [Xanthobacter autotrophicus]MDI4656465.1 hypothetical protein [Xanthobacter autotrophicus]
MTADLKPNQRLLLLTLMARGGSARNRDLGGIVSLEAADRKALVSQGLLVQGPRLPGGSFDLELTDGGWAAARKDFSAPAPSRSSSAAKALYAVLARLSTYMEAQELSAAQVFGGISSTSGDARPAARAIEDAYLALVTRPQGWVRLSALRKALPGFDRASVDAALIALLRARRVSIEPVVDQKTLTEDDRAASLLVGAAPAHHFAFLD